MVVYYQLALTLKFYKLCLCDEKVVTTTFNYTNM